jgi:transcriptional regulator with XRE-family HTH domain
MKDIGLILRTEIEKRGLHQTILAHKTGYSRAHFWQLIQKADLTCSQLEKMCIAFGLSPLSFFEDVEGLEVVSVPKSSSDDDETKQLKTLLKEKQKRIEALEEALASTKELLQMYRDKSGTNNL